MSIYLGNSRVTGGEGNIPTKFDVSAIYYPRYNYHYPVCSVMNDVGEVTEISALSVNVLPNSFAKPYDELAKITYNNAGGGKILYAPQQSAYSAITNDSSRRDVTLWTEDYGYTINEPCFIEFINTIPTDSRSISISYEISGIVKIGDDETLLFTSSYNSKTIGSTRITNGSNSSIRVPIWYKSSAVTPIIITRYSGSVSFGQLYDYGIYRVMRYPLILKTAETI